MIRSALIAGCGYLGRRVAQVWRSRELNVSVITRSAERAAEFCGQGLNPVVLDLAAPDADWERSPKRLPAADVVLWAVGFDRSAGSHREQIWLNGLQWFIRHLTTPPKRLIYISSTGVYGDASGESIDESTIPAPVTESGQCCLKAEDLVRREIRQISSSTQVTILRMAGIYGPNRLLRRIDDLNRRTPLPGNPDHWLNLIHVDDAVRVVDSVAHAVDVPDLINVVSSQTVTRRKYYHLLANLASTPAPVFAEATAAPPAATSSRQSSGHRRIISRCAETLAPLLQFDSCEEGLRDAFARTVDQ
ncbi:MAG: NAD-dependent epimerase/dehydratase family protein [Planctomycetaceae bacterium]